MNSPSPLPTLLWRVVPLLAVLLLAGSGRAVAGCGDHVVMMKRNAEGHIEPASAENQSKPPCHGPNCSASPVDQPAPLTSAPVQQTSVKEVFTPPAPSESADPPGVRRPFEFPSGSPVRLTTSIFHPPRHPLTSRAA